MKNEKLNSWTIPEITVTMKSGPEQRNKVQIGTVASAEKEIRPYFEPEMQYRENAWAFYLNTQNEMIGAQRIATGGIDCTIMDQRIIFSTALKILASAVIIAHNHPSGVLRPSSIDIAMTEKLQTAGRIMKIELVDHLILTAEGYFSFKEAEII
jgi:DNA repair protein RadC